MENLKRLDNKVDYIISHCAPSNIQRIMDGESDFYKTDILTDYFYEIYSSVDFKAWLCRHYHIDRQITENSMFCMNGL